MTFEAEDADEAREIAEAWGIGVEGETREVATVAAPVPEAFNEKTARQMLGGISRATLWREMALGRLERVPNTRRVLITRASIERRCRGTG